MPLLPVGAPDDGGDLTAEHPADVGDGLAHTDLGEVAVDDHREPAELGDRRPAKETWVRRVGLSKMIATACGPSRGGPRTGSALSARPVEDSSPARPGEVVVARKWRVTVVMLGHAFGAALSSEPQDGRASTKVRLGGLRSAVARAGSRRVRPG
jgi:hypothetical protein